MTSQPQPDCHNPILEDVNTAAYYDSRKEGCPLSATLYIIYTNDLPKILENNKCNPVKLNKTSLNCLMYADDIVVQSETYDGLQKALKLIDQFCCRWRLKINTDKSKVMIFNNRKEKMTAFLNNTLLEQVNKYCYVGVILTSTGSFLQHWNICMTKQLELTSQ